MELQNNGVYWSRAGSKDLIASDETLSIEKKLAILGLKMKEIEWTWWLKGLQLTWICFNAWRLKFICFEKM